MGAKVSALSEALATCSAREWLFTRMASYVSLSTSQLVSICVLGCGSPRLELTLRFPRWENVRPQFSMLQTYQELVDVAVKRGWVRTYGLWPV